jgi:hypothetical protein
MARGQQVVPHRTEPNGRGARTELTETVGLLSGLYLYQTYLNIGFLADARAHGVYDERGARSVLTTVLASLDAVDKQLIQLGNVASSYADRQATERLRAIVGLLRTQGQQLRLFWDTGQRAHSERYESTRQEAWRQLNALLGLDKT